MKIKCQLIYLYSRPLANVKMSELKGIKVVEWLQWLKKHPPAKNKGRKSFIHELKLLSNVLNWYRNFINEDFNVPITKKHKQMCVFKKNKPRRPDYYIQPKNANAWVKWLRGHRSNPVYWRLATFMFLTGARVGEACGMLWPAVDFRQRMAKVIRIIRWDHKTRRPHIEDRTKTETSARLLILSNELISILKEIKEEQQIGSELVFTDKQGEPLKYRAIQSAFNAGFTALNLPWRSTHILRHSYATMALIATRDISSVQASLGHTSSRMTKKYAKVIALLNRDTAEKTTKAFNLFGSEKEDNQEMLKCSESKLRKQKFEGYFKNHSEIKFKKNFQAIPTLKRKNGVPYGIRTRVFTVKGWCPRPTRRREHW